MDKRKQLDADYKEKRREIDEIISQLKARVLQHMNELDTKTLTFDDGVRVERVTKVTPRVHDWGSFLDYVQQSGRIDLLQRRVAQSRVLELMNDDVVPPGIDINTEYLVRVKAN